MSEIARRVRAARAYAGLNLQELADRVEIGRMTLIRIERQERVAKGIELNAIAEACGLPRAWFAMPLNWLDEGEVVDVVLSELVDPSWQTGEIRRRMVAEDLDGIYADRAELEALDEHVAAIGGRLIEFEQTAEGDIVAHVARLRSAERIDPVKRISAPPQPSSLTQADIEARLDSIERDVQAMDPPTPSVEDRAREAAQRLGDTPAGSPRSRREAGHRGRAR